MSYYQGRIKGWFGGAIAPLEYVKGAPKFLRRLKKFSEKLYVHYINN